MKQLNPRAVWLFFISFMLRLFFFIFFISVWSIGMLSETKFISLTKFIFIILGIFLFFVIFSYIWARLSYHFYKYELREDGFRKEHGVIWKKYVTIPYDRIQNVDIYRGLIARLLGLSDLHIQTAGMSFTGQRGRITEGRLPGLSREEAERMRDELIQRARQSKNQGL